MHVAATLALGCLLACQVSASSAADPNYGTSSEAARRDAIESIPLASLAPDQYEKIARVLSDTTIFRRLPTRVIRCEPTLHQFIVEHPEILANVWKLLEIDDVALHPTGPDSYRAEDGAGTTGTVEFLHRSHDTYVVYADGSYDGPLFKAPVQGRAVLVLKSAAIREPDGEYYVTTRLDAFIQLDHAGLELLAKTFRPLMVRVADNSFVQTTTFVESLSAAAAATEGGMRYLAARLTDVQPAVRDQLVQVTADIARERELHQASQIRRSRQRMARHPRSTSRAQNP